MTEEFTSYEDIGARVTFAPLFFKEDTLQERRIEEICRENSELEQKILGQCEAILKSINFKFIPMITISP